MAAALIAALGLDQAETKSSFITVLEKGNADSSFVLSCYMWECLVGRSARECRVNGLLLPKPCETSTAVLLLTCHHSVAHYRNQSLKLGLNLTSLSQKGLFEELDLMKVISESLSSDSTCTSELVDKTGCLIIQSLFCLIRSKLITLRKKFKSVCLVIDEDESEHVLGAFLKHTSDLTVTVSGLQTGLSKDVSGCLSVWGRSVPSGTYHYRLLDRQVKMFSPGASSV